LARRQFQSLRRERVVRIFQASIKAYLEFQKRKRDIGKLRTLQELYRHRKEVRQDRNRFLRSRKAAQVLQAVIRSHLERQALIKSKNEIRCLQAAILSALSAQRRKLAKKGLAWIKKRLLIYAARRSFLKKKTGHNSTTSHVQSDTGKACHS